MDTTSIFATKLIKEWEVIPILEFLMESSKKKEKSLPKKISLFQGIRSFNYRMKKAIYLNEREPRYSKKKININIYILELVFLNANF
jgi:hypothetical protein